MTDDAISLEPTQIPACTEIELVAVETLRPHPRNARTHPQKQITAIAKSMTKFGAINPIIVDASGMIVAGHARLAAAKQLALKRVPIIRVSHLTETQVRAYVLADNKLAEKASWDREMLASELGDLQLALSEIGLDLDVTGFDPGEVDAILSDFSEGAFNPDDQIPAMQPSAVARPGDIFVLGRHRLIVGDARCEKTIERLMTGQIADMAFLDPPYNVKIQGHVGGRGGIKHREFACASGEMTSAEFVQFLQTTLSCCARHTIDGAITYVCMDWRHAGELLEAGSTVYDELKNVCVWAKTTPGQGSFYRSQHELIFVYKKGKAPHLNTFELGQHGRTRSNVWTYPGANAFRAGRMDELTMHPTVKPIALVADAMRDCSRRNSIILDAFMGSGTTIMAAEQIGRRAFGIEVDPCYVDVTIRRWQKFTGKDATLDSTGESFDQLMSGRRESPSQTKATTPNTALIVPHE